jgi:hypothetical protein
MPNFDVAIVGGAALGSAVAYFLKAVESLTARLRLLNAIELPDRFDHVIRRGDSPAVFDPGETSGCPASGSVPARPAQPLRA